MKIKINNVPGYRGTINIAEDSYGNPADRFWRRRLKDAKIDNCIEVISETTKKKERTK